jgi:hypothetical protein
MPMLTSRMHPRELMSIFVLEECVGDAEFVFGAEL